MISSDPGGKKPKLLMATSRVVFTTNRRRTITNENNDVIEREIQTGAEGSMSTSLMTPPLAPSCHLKGGGPSTV